MLTTTPSIGWRRTVCEATDLFTHIGYYEEYFDDVWLSTRRSGGGAQDSMTSYELATLAFVHAANQSTRRLLRRGDTVAGLFEAFGELWPEKSASGTCVVLDVWADRDRIYPVIDKKAAEILLVWEHTLAKALRNEFVPAQYAEELAGRAIAELAGGYRLARAYRNRSHFQRALSRVQKGLTEALKKLEN